MKVDNARFQEAQAAEARHHEEAWHFTNMGPLVYVKNIQDYRHWLESFYRAVLFQFGFGSAFFEDKNILEIGSGPYGMVQVLPGKKRVAIDPLMKQFEPFMQEHWDKSIERYPMMAESMPFEDGAFDVIFLLNCLDHTNAPQDVAQSIVRCLAPGGCLFIMNNVKSPIGVFLAILGEKFHIDRFREVFHPHALSQAAIINLFKNRGCKLIGEAQMTGGLHVHTKAKHLLGTIKRALIAEKALYLLFQK